MKVSDVLMAISRQAMLSFRQVNKNISAINAYSLEDAITMQVDTDANVEVSGKVTYENGRALPGASIVEKARLMGHSLTPTEVIN